MKYLVFAALSLMLIACQGNTQEKVELKTQKDSVSYSIGLDVGRNLKKQFVEVNTAALARGIADVIDSTKPMLSEEQVQSVMMAFQQRMMAKHEEAQRIVGEKNKAESEAFLAENKKKEGVITLPDGLQYKILKAGTGKKPKESETVKVHYRGTLIDGTEFDSSVNHGQPGEFPVNSVIKGWTEALQLMPVGSKWQLYIPAELAWGAVGGAGGRIGPNAAVIFDVELLSIN